MADADELAGRLAAADQDSDDAAAGTSNLFQVMRAVEDAEATIRHQLEENARLKEELMRKTRELDRIRSETTNQTSSGGLLDQDRAVEPYRNSAGDKTAEDQRLLGTSSSPLSSQGALPGHQKKYLDSDQPGRVSRKPSGEHISAEAGVRSHFSTPSSRSLSPTRNRKEGEYDSRLSLAGQGMEMSSNIIWKQDLLVKVKEHEEEIAHLRRHLADYSVKEAKILNEKHVLEKRIAYMRMAFDQQQQDLVDAASKALSYRQDIIEENIRLTYALQAAHQERATFVSSLLPILSEYNLQPSVHDAQSIVGNLKVCTPFQFPYVC
ncbi:unnamed protein product [Triticum turgidum subsp. durum]|uniref:Uncharacterized protein n=1 Tax=Triticum turgidum subsp. durum TaxID=4567 RepID=A0A9R0QIS4_TRITD|nr:unnamed protein product [Triticum turgidum subsp. durum]